MKKTMYRMMFPINLIIWILLGIIFATAGSMYMTVRDALDGKEPSYLDLFKDLFKGKK